MQLTIEHVGFVRVQNNSVKYNPAHPASYMYYIYLANALRFKKSSVVYNDGKRAEITLWEKKATAHAGNTQRYRSVSEFFNYVRSYRNY